MTGLFFWEKKKNEAASESSGPRIDGRIFEAEINSLKKHIICEKSKLVNQLASCSVNAQVPLAPKGPLDKIEEPLHSDHGKEGKKRGKYNCTKCGNQTEKHVCAAIELRTLTKNVGTLTKPVKKGKEGQADKIVIQGEKTIVVRDYEFK